MNPLYFTIFCDLKSLKLKVYLQKSLALDVTSPIKVKFSWIEQIHCYRIMLLSPHKYKIIHPKKSTNILATLLHPVCLEWQGQEVGDDNMAAVISSNAVPRTRSGMNLRLFPRGKWPVSEGVLCCPIRGLLKPGGATCLGHAALFLLTDNRGGRRRERAAHHLHLDVAVDCVRKRKPEKETETKRKKEKVQELEEVFIVLTTIRRQNEKVKRCKEPVSVCLSRCHVIHACSH